MTEGQTIQLEREIARDTEATQARLQSQYCPLCGTRLANGKCPYCDKSAPAQKPAAQPVKQFAVAEPKMGRWTMHLFRNTAHLKDYCQHTPAQFVSLGAARGMRDGVIDHTAEAMGAIELA